MGKAMPIRVKMSRTEHWGEIPISEHNWQEQQTSWFCKQDATKFFKKCSFVTKLFF